MERGLRKSWTAAFRRLSAGLAAMTELTLRLEGPAETICLHGREESESELAGTLPLPDCFPEGWVLRYAARPALAGLEPMLAGLVDAASRLSSLEADRQGLFDELNSSWETLHSVYELIGRKEEEGDLGSVMDAIVARIAALKPGTQVAIWTLDEEILHPAAWRNCAMPRRQTLGRGLLTKAIWEGRSLGLHGEELREHGGLEEEFLAAEAVAMSPIRGATETFGVLAVWHRLDLAFGARLSALLEAVTSHLSYLIENDRSQNEMAETIRMRKEVEIGGRIQQSLLLGRPPDVFPGLDIATFSVPSAKIDGDFIDFFQHRGSCLDVLVGDVMGKGFAAALVGAAVKTQFLRMGRHVQGPHGEFKELEPEAFVASVHEAVAPRLFEVDRFVTACLTRLDMERSTLTYVDCGHTDTLLSRADGSVEVLKEDLPGRVNLPFGLDARARFQGRSVSIRPGDVLVYYSDGVSEAMNAARGQFGTEGIRKVLEMERDGDAHYIAQSIIAAVNAFAGVEGIRDDLTLVVIKVTDEVGDRVVLEQARDFSCESGQLSTVRDFVEEFCGFVPPGVLDEGAVESMKLGVNEAFQNVMDHGYGKRAEGGLRLEAILFTRRIVFRLTDWGKPFQGRSVAPPAFDGSRSHGFGVFMMREVFDGVRYQRAEGQRNILTLTKRFPMEV